MRGPVLKIARRTGIHILQEGEVLAWAGRTPPEIPEFLDAISWALLAG
jgi:hypothetical protein